MESPKALSKFLGWSMLATILGCSSSVQLVVGEKTCAQEPNLQGVDLP